MRVHRWLRHIEGSWARDRMLPWPWRRVADQEQIQPSVYLSRLHCSCNESVESALQTRPSDGAPAPTAPRVAPRVKHHDGPKTMASSTGVLRTGMGFLLGLPRLVTLLQGEAGVGGWVSSALLEPSHASSRTNTRSTIGALAGHAHGAGQSKLSLCVRYFGLARTFINEYSSMLLQLSVLARNGEGIFVFACCYVVEFSVFVLRCSHQLPRKS